MSAFRRTAFTGRSDKCFGAERCWAKRFKCCSILVFKQATFMFATGFVPMASLV